MASLCFLVSRFLSLQIPFLVSVDRLVTDRTQISVTYHTRVCQVILDDLWRGKLGTGQLQLRDAAGCLSHGIEGNQSLDHLPLMVALVGKLVCPLSNRTGIYRYLPDIT